MSTPATNFLCGFFMPTGYAFIYWLVARKQFDPAMTKRMTTIMWREQAVIAMVVGLIAISDGGLDIIKGAAVSMALCMLFDDDVHKKGRKAAKLIGDKSRQILESMRERMTPQPLPGLSAVR